MRETKFRGRDIKTRNLGYGWGCFTDENSRSWIISDSSPTGTFIGYQVSEIQQTTGLKDKNGREIYEGDIVKTSQTQFPIKVIQWQPRVSSWNVHPTGHHSQAKHLIVIGNINENPDLLK